MFVIEKWTQKLKISQEHSRAPMSSHESLWALMSTVFYGTKALCVVWVSWRYAHECSWKLMSAVGAMRPCSWVLMVSCECSWMLISTHECGTIVPWALLSTIEGPWPLLVTHKPLKATMSTRDHGTMVQTALVSADKHSWAGPHSANTTHSTLALNLTVLIVVNGWSRVLMGGLECSWVVLSAHGRSWILPSDHECVFSWFSNKKNVNF